MTSMRRWLWAFAAALLLATPALGQEYRGRVQGSLTDEAQLALPGAQVTLRNDATGVSVTRTTGSGGTLPLRLRRPWHLHADRASSAASRRSCSATCIVQARGDVTVDVTMKIAGLAETVTVEASPVAMQFNTSSKDLTLDTKAGASRCRSSAAIRRSWRISAPSSATPATRTRRRRTTTGPATTWTWAAARGATTTSCSTARRSRPGPKVAYTPPMDAIAEFNVATNAVDAEFGHSAGGIISMSMKSGTNAYHGSGYYVGRNPDWNAVTNRVTRQHSDNTYSQAGGTLGMPLRRNKVFLFGTFESSRVTEVLPRTLTLPTELERQGDFSQSFNRDGTLRMIYDPWTSRFGRRRTHDHPRSVSRQPHSARALGSAGVAPHREPLGAERAGRRPHRTEQLPIQPGVRTSST